MNKILYVMCGPPASGKTTWVKEHLTQSGIHISRDEIRFSMLKDEDEYFVCEKEVLKTFYSQLQEAINDERYSEIYADATHLTAKARTKFLNNLHLPADLMIIPVYFNTSVKVCLARNERREGRAFVPESIIREMCGIATAPSQGENKYIYNDIIILNQGARTWVTSDLHFNHEKEFLYEPRGFESIKEHDEEIIKNWNATVSPEDIVYLLGDVFLGSDKEYGKSCLEQLNGNIKLILGNHDGSAKQQVYESCPNVSIVGYSTLIKYKKYNIYLSHFPTIVSNYDRDKPLKARVINLCGHSHTKDKWADYDKGLIYHCELDSHNNYPVLLDDIITEIKEKIKENNE